MACVEIIWSLHFDLKFGCRFHAVFSLLKNISYVFMGKLSESRVKQETSYPRNGNVKITVSGEGRFAVALRVPEYADSVSVSINRQPCSSSVKDGYMLIERDWADGDVIDIDIPMEIRLMRANPKVRANAGRAAVTRGPVVYCAEEADNGDNLSALIMRSDFREAHGHAFSDEAVIINVSGEKDAPETDELYFPVSQILRPAVEITLIPYYLWGNRGKGEMSVWLRYSM